MLFIRLANASEELNTLFHSNLFISDEKYSLLFNFCNYGYSFNIISIIIYLDINFNKICQSFIENLVLMPNINELNIYSIIIYIIECQLNNDNSILIINHLKYLTKIKKLTIKCIYKYLATLIDKIDLMNICKNLYYLTNLTKLYLCGIIIYV